MELVFAAVLLCYTLLIILLIAGWNRIMKTPVPRSVISPSISVIIPARNEEKNIRQLLTDLCQQSEMPLEIIVVNDHSEDRTKDRVEDMKQYSDTIKIINLDKVQGKKQAITCGVRSASGSVIATVDGDCRVQKDWMASVGKWFSDDEVQFVFGGVAVKSDNTFSGLLQAIELSSLIGTGAATLAFAAPSMCNGANLAYRKDVFLKVKGYEGNYHILSGDDEFLMKKVFAIAPHGIRFNNDQSGIVAISPIKTWQEFFNQRIRWAGKWKSRSTRFDRILPIVIFTFHLSILIIFPFLVYTDAWRVAVVSYLFKALAELIFLKRVSRFLGLPWSWAAFILLELFYSFYAVFFGIMANQKTFEWKGRKLTQAT